MKCIIPKELHTARTVQRSSERQREAVLQVGKHHAGEDLNSDPQWPLSSHLVEESGGYSLVELCRLLTAVASLVAGHRL